VYGWRYALTQKDRKINSMEKMRVLISGAGIAGLALARRLDDLKINYVLVEQRGNLEQGSSGIALPFNAVRALAKLGLADQVLAQAHRVDSIEYTKSSGRRLALASLREAPFEQDHFVALRRSALHRILAQGLQQPIHFNTQIVSLAPVPPGCELAGPDLESAVPVRSAQQVQFSDPLLDGVFDLVVAAEGLHSSLRIQSFPSHETVLDHKVPNWRFIVDYPDHGLQPVYMLGRTELFMAYPISADALYCYGHVYDKKGEYAASDREGVIARQHIERLFSHFGGPVSAILSRLKTQDIISGRLKSVDQPYFVSDRAVFVGDAGNACSPLLQQGAAAALEDVLSLSSCLSRCDRDHSLQQALQAYELERRPRVEWLVHASDGPLKKMNIMQYALGAFLRNALIRTKGPLNVQGWRKLASEQV
jgi:2-polyprenyl-6-methoxyphenol hydroxylase-like FAD-dependent oxidoreductase